MKFDSSVHTGEHTILLLTGSSSSGVAADETDSFQVFRCHHREADCVTDCFVERGVGAVSKYNRLITVLHEIFDVTHFVMNCVEIDLVYLSTHFDAAIERKHVSETCKNCPSVTLTWLLSYRNNTDSVTVLNNEP
jgi:hypothetical protein